MADAHSTMLSLASRPLLRCARPMLALAAAAAGMATVASEFKVEVCSGARARAARSTAGSERAPDPRAGLRELRGHRRPQLRARV